ncbi:MAG: glycosyltransferase [Nitrospinota bacterium]|jgi:glycosyltransferase involved in cell wall biosynthesis|nr:glycosyltransferase [Nitrospinota bacterium]
MLDILHTESSAGWGGQEARTILEADHLSRRGHRVRVAGPSGSGIEGEARRRGLPFLPAPIRSVADPLALVRIFRLLRRERPAILHTHSSKDSWLAGLAGKSAGVPVIFRTRHVSIPVRAHRLNPVYRIPDRILVTASATRDHLVSRCGVPPDRVITLPTGVDLGRFGPHVSGRPFREAFGFGEGTPVVGIVAQLRGSKGHDHFIEAARILSARNPEARFFIVGDGLWRDLVAEKVRSEKMTARVTLTGFREDIPEVMAALDVLVIASTRTDGIPQAGLQAMATGVPVVGTRVGGIPEVVREGETGLLVEPGDSAALARAVERLLADPARRERMGKTGMNRVRERHSLEAMLNGLESIYEEALRAARGRGGGGDGR